MRCRFCQKKDRTLLKAHAIPEAFFRVLRQQDQQTPLLITNAANRYPKRAPVGVYDKKILCAQCETYFGPYDTYGADCLIHKLDHLFSPIKRREETLAFISEKIDQDRLKMFILSVLWRASVSSHDFYRSVHLGPHESTLRDVISRGNTQSPDEYSVALSKWIVSDQRRDLVAGLINPFLERWRGVNSVRLYLGRVVAYIKVDQRPFPQPISEVVLGRTEKTIMIAREFDQSADFGIMRMVAKRANTP